MKFKIGAVVEIAKDSDLKGLKGKVVNAGTVGGKQEYLVRLPRDDESAFGGGDFWFNEGSLR